jgi:hypothetical protein
MTRPKEFQLVVNFRSHAGIVSCAHSIIELLQKFWPYSIDALSAEEGTVDGKKPIFFTPNNGSQEDNTVSTSTRFHEKRITYMYYSITLGVYLSGNAEPR